MQCSAKTPIGDHPRPSHCRLERAQLQLALAIEQDGAAYLPLFQRIEREINLRRGEAAALERIQRLVEEHASPR